MPAALITGASSGIGAVFARVAARIGLDVILVARRRDKLEALAAGFEGRPEILAADLADEADLARVAERAAAEERLELLINNAGFGSVGRFWELDLAGQERMHRVHVLATMRLTHAALRGMVARQRGAIINVSSVAGFAPAAGSASYCATKAWITTFTEALHLELRSRRSPVRVQALCPGFTYSEFHDVLGLDRKAVPENWWLPAEYVVAESFRGLSRGQVIVIPGWRYKLLAALLKCLPRPLYYTGSLVYSRRMGREGLSQPPGDRPSLR